MFLYLEHKQGFFQWLKFEKSFFNFKRDLYICLAYIPLSQSSYRQNLPTDLLENPEKEISYYSTCGDVMICGNLKAGTSTQDYIVNDETDHLPVYQSYEVDLNSIPRVSKDAVIDSRGKNFLDVCIGNQIRILNGRCFGDMLYSKWSQSC